MTIAGLLASARARLERLTLFQRIAIGNAVILLFAVGATALLVRRMPQQAEAGRPLLAMLGGIVLGGLALNTLIVLAALRPLRDLGRLAKRLQNGGGPRPPAPLKNPDPYTLRMAGTLQALFLQLEEHNRELRALSERAISAQEDERRAIAQGLHDDTGQALSMLIIQLDRLDGRLAPEDRDLKAQVAEARALAANALRELRRILAGLRPAILDDLGLVPAIRWYARSHLEAGGLRVVVKAPSPAPELSPALATTLFRIVQESGANILRHAQARSATIALQVGAGQVRLSVEDDGRGFNPQHASRDAVELQQLGLLGIRERVELLGGRVEIESKPGVGTRVGVTIPLGEPRGEDPHPAG